MFKETGRIVYLGEIRTGVSSRTGNEWRSIDVVIETLERYPRKVAGTIMSGSYIDTAQLQLGETVDVLYEAESHEFNSNWYTELTIRDVLTNGVSRFVPGASQLNR